MRYSATILLLALAGCATNSMHQTYAGEARPASEVATILGAGDLGTHKVLKGLDEGVAILEVDGEDTVASFGGEYALSVTLLPGRHVLRVRWGEFGVIATGKLWLDAEAGHTYVIQRRPEGDKHIRLWIEDTTTGRAVGGPVED